MFQRQVGIAEGKWPGNLFGGEGFNLCPKGVQVESVEVDSAGGDAPEQEEKEGNYKKTT